MVSFDREVKVSPEKFNTKQVFILIAIIGVFSLSICIGALFLTTFTGTSKPSEDYTVLTLVLYQSAQYTQEGTTYEFSYVSGGQGNLLQVHSNGQTMSYAAVPGTTPNPFNLKVAIYSATEQMLVLHITSPETINDVMAR
jgi:hypothetical protein